MANNDPLVLLARHRIIRLSAELEVQLSQKDGCAPILEVVVRFRERAAESMAALATVNLFTEEGRTQALMLQNEVKRYDELFAEIKRIVAEGIQEDKNMRDSDREETLDLLAQRADGERIAIELGLIDNPAVGSID